MGVTPRRVCVCSSVVVCVVVCVCVCTVESVHVIEGIFIPEGAALLCDVFCVVLQQSRCDL